MLHRAHLSRLATFALIATFAVLAGCQNPRLVDERNALWDQNNELQDDLDRTRMLLDQANSEIARLERMADRPIEVQAGPAPQAQTDAFSGIADIEAIAGRGTMTVRVAGDVLFAPGQAELRSAARQTLSDVARVIQREYPNQTIRIEGYTDTDPIRVSGWSDNLELSAQRAMTVHRHLQEQGIGMDRMHIAGFGEARPRGSKEQSRRVEIVVLLNE